MTRNQRRRSKILHRLKMQYVRLWHECKQLQPKVRFLADDSRIWEYYALERADGLFP